jgi:hypothetical protein
MDELKSSDNASQESESSEVVDIFTFFCKEYFEWVGISGEDHLEIFVANNRARKIQEMFRLRWYAKVAACKLIQ